MAYLTKSSRRSRPTSPAPRPTAPRRHSNIPFKYLCHLSTQFFCTQHMTHSPRQPAWGISLFGVDGKYYDDRRTRQRWGVNTAVRLTPIFTFLFIAKLETPHINERSPQEIYPKVHIPSAIWANFPLNSSPIFPHICGTQKPILDNFMKIKRFKDIY